MVTAARFIRPISTSLTATISPRFPFSRNPFHGQPQPLKTLTKRLEPLLQSRISNLQSKLSTYRIYASPGSMQRMGSIFGAPVAFGLTNSQRPFAYAMDGLDILVDDHHVDLFSASDLEEDSHTFWAFARKFWLPVAFFVTVLMNWDHPIILATKVILILLGTKPSPFSVYLFVEKVRNQPHLIVMHAFLGLTTGATRLLLRRQAMLKDPFLYKFKSLHAKKVEVEDYKILCLARIELKDQKFTLIGILGSWWVLPSATFQEAFVALRTGVLKNY